MQSQKSYFKDASGGLPFCKRVGPKTFAKVIIYGTGSAGRSLFMWLKKCRPDVRVLGFIDSFKNGRLAGKPVYKFDDFKSTFKPVQYDTILIASGAGAAISMNLDNAGITNYSFVPVPTYLMENLLPTPLPERLNEWKIKFKTLFFKRDIHLFFGEHGGKFIGNNKYYYLYIRDKLDSPVYWVVEDGAIFDELKACGVDVLDFREKGFMRYLLRASHFYFDNMTWQRKYPWLRFFKAKIIHMSHGVGLKLTEKMLIPESFMKALSPKEIEKLESKIFKNDLLISTSEFYAKNVSAPAYNTPLDRITCSGYPKNDIFYRDIEGELLFSDIDTLRKIDDFKRDNHKIIVYAPTFRDMDSAFAYADVIDYNVFNTFLAAHKLVLVIKGHTGVSVKKDTPVSKESSSNILIYRNDRDGYPMLKRADLLITDYSSIYMDFLHTRKPVLFFVYDYTEYIGNHRDIQFDYEEMTPGPKAKNYDELLRWVSHFLIEGKDGFEEKRGKIFDLAYLYHDGNSSLRVSLGVQPH